MSDQTNNLNKDYPKAFSLVEEVVSELESIAYLWGGWIPDVYSERLLREHDDAEYFVVNLYSIRETLIEKFKNLGWTTTLLENDDLKVEKGQLKIQIGHIEIRNKQVYWYHNGEKEQIVFPKEWLCEEPIIYMGSNIHAVKPIFQYVLKLHPELMNTNWSHREKDLTDIEILKGFIDTKSVTRLEQKMFNVANTP